MKVDTHALVSALVKPACSSAERSLTVTPDFERIDLPTNLLTPNGRVPVHTLPAVTFCRGLPWLSEECSRRWLSERVIFFPQGLPNLRRIAPVSSRLKQRLDLEPWWFDLLRTVTLQCDCQSEAVVIVPTTAPAEAASRAAMLFGRPVIRFHLPSTTSCRSLLELREWADSCLMGAETVNSDSDLLTRATADTRDAHPPTQSEWNVLVSPKLELPETAGFDTDDCSIPLADRLLFAAACRVQVLSSRPQGNVAELIRRHLNDPQRDDAPVLIASHPDGSLPAATSEFPPGWIPWLLEPCAQTPDHAPSGAGDSTLLGMPSVAGLSCPFSEPEEWLLHWTRPATGPWPDEAEEDFLDALILRTELADRSALAALLRIVTARRMIASSEGIRGGHAVVAWTGVPLCDFRARRIFRKHRHRFDFEPWGIAVRKADLIRLGARPVIYGDDGVWTNLSMDDHPFFQQVAQGGPSSSSAEYEWRTLSDVDLNCLPGCSVQVFADNPEAARIVSGHCPWRVLILPK